MAGNENTIGERIREQRLKRGFTQDYLANELHVSAQAVSKWENGQTAPDISLLVPLSKVLEIGVNELLGGDRRAEHERNWQSALAFGEELTLLAAEDALKEFPDDEKFLYRRACDEYTIGMRKNLMPEKYRYLSNAETHFSELHERFPDNDKYISALAEVLFARGEPDRAVELACTIKDHGERSKYVAKFIGGDEEIRHEQKMLAASMNDLYGKLLALNTRESINAAHALLDVMMPEGKRLRNDYWKLWVKDACLCLSEGDTDGYRQKLAKAYETVNAYDALPREPIKYDEPMFDRLQNNRDKQLELFAFLNEFLFNEKLCRPESLELRRRIADEKLTYHRLWRHEWIAFYQFCWNHICGENYLNFGTGCNVTYEENQTGMSSFIDKRRNGRLGLVEYYRHEIERLVGGGKMTGVVAHSMNVIVAYCNCGNKEKYACLPIPDEYRKVEPGTRVLSIIEIMTARNFADCGVEEKLLTTALEWAKSDGYTHAEVYLSDRMILKDDSMQFDELTALYEKLGFSIAHDLTEKNQRKYIMRKVLVR